MTDHLTLTRLRHEGGEAVVPGASVSAWSQIRFDVFAVRQIGAPAVCISGDGDLWEYEDGELYVTAVLGAGRRVHVPPGYRPPPGPWRHFAACDCEVCRFGTT